MPQHDEKADFCRSLDWDLTLQWYDKVGLHLLDDERVAKVELETRGTRDHYPGFQVTILNKREGVIDSKFFRFDDYLPRRLDSRKDGRNDYPLRGNTCFHVIGYCGWGWYVAVPADTKPFCEAIKEYVETFR